MLSPLLANMVSHYHPLIIRIDCPALHLRLACPALLSLLVFALLLRDRHLRRQLLKHQVQVDDDGGDVVSIRALELPPRDRRARDEVAARVDRGEALVVEDVDDAHRLLVLNKLPVDWWWWSGGRAREVSAAVVCGGVGESDGGER